MVKLCPICGKKVDVRSFKQHELRHQKELEKENLLARGIVCEHCGKVFYKDYRKNRMDIPKFCSRSCTNSRTFTEETKKQISISVNSHFPEKLQLGEKEFWRLQKRKRNYQNKNKRVCLDCGKEYFLFGKRKYPDLCKDCAFKKGGEASASKENSHNVSKSELYFRKLCQEKGYNIVCNKPMFNGFDADIIFLDYKIALHWNGPWHYEGMINGIKGYSWKQIHERDRRRYKNVEDSGYKNYIIRYTERFNKEKVQREFEKFEKFLRKEYNISR